MLGLLRRYFKRRRLAAVVAGVPAVLKRKYGGQDAYSAAQVLRSAETLKLRRPVSDYALAACCSATEFADALKHQKTGGYTALRAELAVLYAIDRPDFNCAHLRKLRDVPRSSQWTTTVGDGDGLSTGHGG